MNFLPKFLNRFVTNSERPADISKTRDISGPKTRDMKQQKLVMESLSCPHCSSTTFVKKGVRVKKRETIQLYRCSSCYKVFTPRQTKGKQYPLDVMLDAVSIYNLGYSLNETCRIVNERSAAEVATGVAEASDHETSHKRDMRLKNQGNTGSATLQPSTLSNWLSETTELCRFSRMRAYALKNFSPKDMVITATLAHRQLYRYRFHQAKCDLMLKEEYWHRRFTPLKEFLEMIPVECPHQYFQEGLRASEAPLTFSKTQMIVRAKQNYATRLAAFILQSVNERKLRHEALQKFMLANDSVTVATEVPVYLTRDDIEHMKTQLGFEIYNSKLASEIARSFESASLPKTSATTAEVDIVDVASLPKLITGHIDFIQIRNGQIHILDYKPRAEKERPIEQLTLYAMALSRLTGLRLFEFKCAWFDEKDYFEFYPLHVLHKPKKAARRRKIITTEGTYLVNKNPGEVEHIRPLVIN